MPIVHLTAKLRESTRERLDRTRAPWLFSHLRGCFPDVLAAVLMPNHPHLLVEVVDIAAATATFRQVLAAFARGSPGAPPIWAPIPAPDVVGGDKILRAIRYVALNPARAGLVDDPIAWYWSTHRDVLGATDDPWVTFERLERHLPAHLADVGRLHAYISADPSTKVDGTRLPRVPTAAELEGRPLAEMLAAAAAATRGSITDHRRSGATRDIFVWLAATHGWADNRRLAELCGVTRQAIAKIRRGAAPPGLAAARLCLGDRRLLVSVGGPRVLSLDAAPIVRPY